MTNPEPTDAEVVSGMQLANEVQRMIGFLLVGVLKSTGREGAPACITAMIHELSRLIWAGRLGDETPETYATIVHRQVLENLRALHMRSANKETMQ